jgi:hypothetical protein
MNRKKNGKNGRKIGQANNALHGNRGRPQTSEYFL